MAMNFEWNYLQCFKCYIRELYSYKLKNTGTRGPFPLKKSSMHSTFARISILEVIFFALFALVSTEAGATFTCFVTSWKKK